MELRFHSAANLAERMTYVNYLCLVVVCLNIKAINSVVGRIALKYMQHVYRLLCVDLKRIRKYSIQSGRF